MEIALQKLRSSAPPGAKKEKVKLPIDGIRGDEVRGTSPNVCLCIMHGDSQLWFAVLMGKNIPHHGMKGF